MNYSGIYKILNTITGDFYIGSSSRTLKSRWYDHRKNLRGNRHCNKHLQFAWNKYGEKNFEFIEVEKVIPEECIRREQFYIDTLKPIYNKAPIAGSILGIKKTKESIEKQRCSLKRYYEVNDAPWLGKKFSNEHRKKLSNSHKGYEHTEEQKKKISESNKQYIKENNIDMSVRAMKKPIICITTNQQFISIRDAAKFFNLNECHLSVCLKKGRLVKGLEFRYV